MKSNFNDQVYRIVRKIPKGKVTTYGEIALRLGQPRWARQVGWALHQNSDTRTPCHRVVDRTGRLAPNFAGPSKFQRSGAFDGWVEQKRRLEVEGIRFSDKMHVDLRKSLWSND